MRKQQNTQDILEKNKILAELINKPRQSRQQIETSKQLNHSRFKNTKSNSSIQDNKLQRRSNSAKFKTYKQSKFHLSQVYIKKSSIIDQHNQKPKISNPQQSFNESKKQNSQIENNKFQRQNIRKQQLKNRRPLTPHKSEEQIKQNGSKYKIINNQKQIMCNQILNQKEIQIALMQEKLRKCEQENKNLKCLVTKSDNQSDLLVKEIYSLKKKMIELEKELKVKCIKFNKLQNLLLQNEQNLNETKTKLEKFKQVNQQNRINQLQIENKKFQQKNRQLLTQNQKIKKQNANLLITQQKLNQQLNYTNFKISKFQANHFTKEKSYLIDSIKQQYLNQQITQFRDNLNLNKDLKQKQLEQIIENLRIQLFEAQTKIQKQQIKIDCLSRKQEKSLQYVRKQKQKQYTILKQRFRKFLLEYHKLRKEYNDLKLQNVFLKRQKTRRYSEQQFSYELTPQKR